MSWYMIWCKWNINMVMYGLRWTYDSLINQKMNRKRTATINIHYSNVHVNSSIVMGNLNVHVHNMHHIGSPVLICLTCFIRLMVIWGWIVMIYQSVGGNYTMQLVVQKTLWTRIRKLSFIMIFAYLKLRMLIIYPFFHTASQI